MKMPKLTPNVRPVGELPKKRTEAYSLISKTIQDKWSKFPSFTEKQIMQSAAYSLGVDYDELYDVYKGKANRVKATLKK